MSCSSLSSLALSRQTVAPHEKRDLRVLLVTEAAAAGVGRHVVDLAEGLAKRGCQVTLAYSPGRIDKQFQQRVASLADVRLCPLPMRRAVHPLDAWSAIQLTRVAQRLGPFDVIHGHSSKAGALARWAGWRLKTPTVYTPHAFITLDPLLRRHKRFIYGRIERLLSTLGQTRVIAVCEDEAAHARALGIPAERIRVVFNGQAEFQLPTREQARQRLGIPPDWLVLGFIGRLAHQKAPQQMLSAFIAVARQEPRARLAIVGSGPMETALRREAESAGVSDRILWLGNADGPAVMPAFDIFCLTSLYEVTPYVVLEALQAGVPQVVTRVGITGDVVERSGCGLVVEVNHPEEFTAALLQVALDAPLRQRLAAAAVAQGNPYSLAAMVEGTLDVYRELVAPSPRSSPRWRGSI